MAARIREVVSEVSGPNGGIPVIVAGRIRSPAVARDALEGRQTDLIGLGRPFLADPDWVEKVEEEREEEILLCAACHQGCLGELRKGEGTHCLFNPLTGREADVEITSVVEPRRVMVVGGGPAGLEAARIAAKRGHRVLLFEKEDHLGGQLRLAARVPHKEEFLDVIRQQEREARKAGADIRLGRKVTKEEVEAEDPDAVVLATGGIPLPAAFPGLEDIRWALASDVLDGLVEVATPSVLLVGGGLVGLEAADFLSARGIRVVLVEMLEEVGTDLDPLPRTMLLKRLEKQGVGIHTGTRILRVGPGEAVVKKEGERARLPCETLILAVGVEPNRQLAEDLADSGMKLHVVGDARDPRGAGEAIWEGFQAGNAL